MCSLRFVFQSSFLLSPTVPYESTCRKSSEDPSEALPALRSGLYTPPPGTEARVRQLEYEVHTVGGLGDFLQVPVLASLMTAVVERYFPLNANELDEMDTEPETFHHDDDSASFEDQLR